MDLFQLTSVRNRDRSGTRVDDVRYRNRSTNRFSPFSLLDGFGTKCLKRRSQRILRCVHIHSSAHRTQLPMDYPTGNGSDFSICSEHCSYEELKTFLFSLHYKSICSIAQVKDGNGQLQRLFQDSRDEQ